MSENSIESPDLEILKYPIGKFKEPVEVTQEKLSEFIKVIASFPERISKEVHNLNDNQLDTPYRPQGWTIRQVVHHCADSHLNSFTRFKLALTEDNPTIKPYYEDRWAMLSDTLHCPVEESLILLSGLHKRWTMLMNSLTPLDLEKGFIHPEHGKKLLLKNVMGLYAWHCNHHLAHITVLKEKRGW